MTETFSSKKRTFPEPSPSWEEVIFLTPGPSSLPVSPKAKNYSQQGSGLQGHKSGMLQPKKKKKKVGDRETKRYTPRKTIVRAMVPRHRYMQRLKFNEKIIECLSSLHLTTIPNTTIQYNRCILQVKELQVRFKKIITYFQWQLINKILHKLLKTLPLQHSQVGTEKKKRPVKFT